VHAANACKPPPMQLAGGAANVVFVVGAYANSQRKKSKLQQSDHSGIAHLLCHRRDKRHF